MLQCAVALVRTSSPAQVPPCSHTLCPLPRRLMPLLSLAVLAGVAAVGYRLYYAPFMRHQALYALGALVVYWFSVSGARRRSLLWG